MLAFKGTLDMADGYQINRAMQDLGTLWAAEHTEGDDDGVTQIETLVKGLRKFKQREDDERQRLVAHPALREATYGEPGSPTVWYDAGDGIRDASDLYTVLEELHGTGSPNLENTQAAQLVNHLQRGGGLGEMQIGLLRRLLAKHKSAIEKLRRSSDRGGQDILDLPAAGPEARIITETQGA